MQIYYQDITIEVTNVMRLAVVAFAESILRKMQTDSDFPECWTFAAIRFNHIQPVFEYGDDDAGEAFLQESAAIVVHVPLPTDEVAKNRRR